VSWFNFPWTAADKRLLSQWLENRGKSIPFVDESSPNFIPSTQEGEWLPIPYIIEERERNSKPIVVKEKVIAAVIVPANGPRTPIPKWKKESLINTRGMICEACSKTDFDQFHHVDGDPSNHSSQNLKLLCYRCHKMADKVLYWNGKARRRGKRKK
jgi:hypothetical protein